MAMGVSCPISVLKANDVITPMETPFERVLVSNTSAGMIQESGPYVKLNEIWYSQLIVIKTHPREFCSEGLAVGNLAIAAVTMIQQTPFMILPIISGQRRPMRSMNRTVHACAT